MDRTAASLESNIDQAAEQAQATIGVVGERVEGLIDEAPRQTASVVQSVRALSWAQTAPSHPSHRLECSWRAHGGGALPHCNVVQSAPQAQPPKSLACPADRISGLQTSVQHSLHMCKLWAPIVNHRMRLASRCVATCAIKQPLCSRPGLLHCHHAAPPQA